MGSPDWISIIVAIVSLCAGILSLGAAIIPLKRRKENRAKNSIDIKGDNNNVTQDNRQYERTTNIENTIVVEPTIFVYPDKAASSSNDNLLIMGFVLIALSLFIFANIDIFLSIIYVPLSISALLSVLICTCIIMGKWKVYLVHSKAIANILFAFTPAVMSTLFLIQNYLFLSNLNIDEADILQRIKMGSVVLMDYLAILTLLIVQLCMIFAAHIRFPRIQKYAYSLVRLWPLPVILFLIPMLFYFIQK